jgi:hypothetical protein
MVYQDLCFVWECTVTDQCVARQQLYNTFQHATIQEAVFSVSDDVTTVDSDHVPCVFCRSDRFANRLAG